MVLMTGDTVLILKLAGAAIVFVLGLWIGLGMPGVKERPTERRDWRPVDRFRATWINRVFFRMDQAPRRFDTGRLIVPPADGDRREEDEESGRSGGVVRLRRSGG